MVKSPNIGENKGIDQPQKLKLKQEEVIYLGSKDENHLGSKEVIYLGSKDENHQRAKQDPKFNELPLIITCPLIGAELTRDVYPQLPLTSDELADSAEKAVRSGASIIHLHVRDEKGLPTQRLDVFEEVSEKIKARVDCVLQFSTGGAVDTPTEDRWKPLALRPEMATLSLGTLNFGSEIFENKESTVKEISEKIFNEKIIPEFEIFDYGMLDIVPRWMKMKILPPFERVHFDFVLGVPGGMSAHIKNLLFLISRAEEICRQQSWPFSWSVAGVGAGQLPMAIHAMILGGHARVGLEDNIYYSKGIKAKSNAELIQRVVRIAKEIGRIPATPSETRNILMNIK